MSDDLYQQGYEEGYQEAEWKAREALLAELTTAMTGIEQHRTLGSLLVTIKLVNPGPNILEVLMQSYKDAQAATSTAHISSNLAGKYTPQPPAKILTQNYPVNITYDTTKTEGTHIDGAGNVSFNLHKPQAPQGSTTEDYDALIDTSYLDD